MDAVNFYEDLQKRWCPFPSYFYRVVGSSECQFSDLGAILDIPLDGPHCWVIICFLFRSSSEGVGIIFYYCPIG